MHSKYSKRSVSLVILPLLFFSVVLTGQRAQEVVVPLKNWAAPLYWQPNQAEIAERETGVGVTPKITFSTNQVSTSALTFVAITPCRLVDTRGPAANFNGMSPFSGPSLGPSTTTTFPVQSAAEATADTTPAPCGTIPSIAQAYSFNITAIPKTAGGIAFVTVWPAGSPQPAVSTINDGQGQILANAAIVPAGTPSGGVNVLNSGPATMDLTIDMNGFYAAPSDLNGNTAVGSGALMSITTGGNNTALGTNVLLHNTSGGANTASGFQAMLNYSTPNYNTAFGYGALAGGSPPSENTGAGNTAIGAEALVNNITGSNNVAVGEFALYINGSGSNNIAIGAQAGEGLTTGSNNIYIGNAGASGDSGVVKIGNLATQTAFYAGGIYGAGLGGSPVMITPQGQLLASNSSRRYKEDIQDMGDASRGLMDLRPVAFRYKKAAEDGSKPLQYGLIAEEVADVYPDLVVYNKDGQPDAVQYQMLPPMLLNEVQKQYQHARQQDETIRRQQGQVSQQQEQVFKQQEQIRSLEARLAALEGLLSGKVPATATVGR
jgi:hypothetical protein